MGWLAVVPNMKLQAFNIILQQPVTVLISGTLVVDRLGGIAAPDVSVIWC